jgi:tetratricopeptide (TPR) repeat protein/transcriptional regulator with XRE-family HTH domain
MKARTMSFGELLKQLRFSAGLTQEGLARAAGLSPRSISDLERGINHTARRDTARLLADALDLEGAARAAFVSAARRGRAVMPALAAEEGIGEDATGVATAMRTLPRDMASFTGREQEVARLMQALERNTAGGGIVGIHAIDGMAGIGKTTFAVHVSHQLTSRFPDGQIFLRLHGHTPGQRAAEPAEALAALLLTIRVPAQQIPADLEARAGLWRDRMSGKKVLLVLDDATGSDQVRPLLPGTDETLVLVTSRRRLAALPEAMPITLDTLQPSQAAELFVRLVDRADLRVADHGVNEVVRLCGYLPLAITLMAGQLKHHHTWTAPDLAADLASARDRLTVLHAEEHSVAAAFDLSYADLTTQQQQLFRRLGLQLGSDIDAYATATLNNSELQATTRLLQDLFAHHLIDEPAKGRYRFHDLIREHARALAMEDDAVERDAAIDRLFEYYLYTAHAADRHLARRTPLNLPALTQRRPPYVPKVSVREQAVTWMEAERSNLHAAVLHAVSEDHTGYAVAIPIVMHGFLRAYGHWGQALTLHEIALVSARSRGDGLGEAAALLGRGDIQHLTGNYPAATASLTHARELCLGLGNRLGEANSISTLGLVQQQTGDHVTAVESFTRALQIYRDLEDLPGEAVALNDLGLAQYLTGDFPAAEDSENRALELFRNLADPNGQATALSYLGTVQQARGNYSAALTSQAEALKLYRDTGTPWGEANALVKLGQVQGLIGDRVAANSNLNRALKLYRELGHRNGEAETLNSLGEFEQACSRPFQAQRRYVQALAIARDIAAPLEEARALEGIGHCLQDSHAEEAVVVLRQALAIYQRVNSPRSERVRTVLNAAS